MKNGEQSAYFAVCGKQREVKNFKELDQDAVSHYFTLIKSIKKQIVYNFMIFYFFALVTKQSAALNSATQHAKPPEFGGKWRTEVS